MEKEHASPQAEAGIGRALRRAREKKGLSPEQVEQSTKIRARYLAELERENFDVLPAVYVLGSLKTYADFLGLDGAALSGELKKQLEPQEPDAPDPLAPEEKGFERAPAAVVGFNQLFLGLGVLIVSALAIMTLVSSAAQNSGQSKVPQVDEPSVRKAPERMDLARNADPERDSQTRAAPRPGQEESGDEKTAQKAGEGKERPGPPRNEKSQENKKEGGGSSPASLFGDVEFVPMPSAGPPEAPAPTAATASSASTASPAPGPGYAAQSVVPSASASPGPYGGSLNDGSSAPAGGFSGAPPSGVDGDPGLWTQDDPSRVSDGIIAGVEKDLREAGIDP